jgi:hypothetical protein
MNESLNVLLAGVRKRRKVQIIDSFHISSRILPNMFRDHASILMEARSKRKPSLATTVVGFGLVSVELKSMKKMIRGSLA